MARSDESIHIATTNTGAGLPIVFSHGWMDDRHAWDGVVNDLSSTYRCVSWDLRGHGGSESPPAGQYTRAHALDDMAHVVDELPQPVVLAGHSLGGYLSLAYTLLNPTQVCALVLVAAGPGFRQKESRDQWNESVAAAAENAEIPPGSEEISKHVDAWVIDSLSDIKCPTLVIVGEHDKRFMASASVFKKQLDVRSTYIASDAGHRVHSKKPSELAGEIRSFLDQL
ncbi:MAG: alpha/beta fold hydrolase [Acidimicrobiales bacterium]